MYSSLGRYSSVWTPVVTSHVGPRGRVHSWSKCELVGQRTLAIRLNPNCSGTRVGRRLLSLETGTRVTTVA